MLPTEVLFVTHAIDEALTQALSRKGAHAAVITQNRGMAETLFGRAPSMWQDRPLSNGERFTYGLVKIEYPDVLWTGGYQIQSVTLDADSDPAQRLLPVIYDHINTLDVFRREDMSSSSWRRCIQNTMIDQLVRAVRQGDEVRAGLVEARLIALSERCEDPSLKDFTRSTAGTLALMIHSQASIGKAELQAYAQLLGAAVTGDYKELARAHESLRGYARD